jgi:hypothetical protein
MRAVKMITQRETFSGEAPQSETDAESECMFLA